jgi:hypothetical protein
MMKLKQTLLTLGLAATTSLFLAGCSDGGNQAAHDHSHDGHDHAGHDHAHEAGAAAGAAAQMTGLIDKPSAEQIAAAKAYPLAVCIGSGEELGSMGDPVVMVYNGQQIKFCCKGCVDDFKADPASHIAKLTAAK